MIALMFEEEREKFRQQHETLREQERREGRKEWRDSVAIWIAIVAALFTGWQSCEAHQARKDAHEQFMTAQSDSAKSADTARIDARNALEIQTALATRSADQATRSADAAELSAKALKDQSRAQVGFTEFKASYEPTLGEILSQCAIKNGGQTPALNVRIEQVFLGTEMVAFNDNGLVYMWPPLPDKKPHLDPHGTLLPPTNEEKGCLTRQDRVSPESVTQYPMIFYVSWKDVNGDEWITGRCLEYQPKFREYWPCLFAKFVAVVKGTP